jgi:mRNA-degrading endonuclease toxin of MazEF toxin-antitoxin module
VALPEPVPGLIIRYSYLWYREHLQGREEGQKDRPCAIVAAIRADDNGDTRVLVLPITHSPPDHASLAVEIPAKTKQRLQLDDARSWVVLSEWNEFVWPGPDLRRLPNADDSSVAYGMLPPSLFASIRDRFIALLNTRAAHQVQRT